MKESDSHGAAGAARTLVQRTIVRAARGARSFLFIQPIISLICVVVLAAAVVIYYTPLVLCLKRYKSLVTL